MIEYGICVTWNTHKPFIHTIHLKTWIQWKRFKSINFCWWNLFLLKKIPEKKTWANYNFWLVLLTTWSKKQNYSFHCCCCCSNSQQYTIILLKKSQRFNIYDYYFCWADFFIFYNTQNYISFHVLFNLPIRCVLIFFRLFFVLFWQDSEEHKSLGITQQEPRTYETCFYLIFFFLWLKLWKISCKFTYRWERRKRESKITYQH